MPRIIRSISAVARTAPSASAATAVVSPSAAVPSIEGDSSTPMQVDSLPPAPSSAEFEFDEEDALTMEQRLQRKKDGQLLTMKRSVSLPIESASKPAAAIPSIEGPKPASMELAFVPATPLAILTPERVSCLSPPQRAQQTELESESPADSPILAAPSVKRADETPLQATSDDDPSAPLLVVPSPRPLLSVVGDSKHVKNAKALAQQLQLQQEEEHKAEETKEPAAVELAPAPAPAAIAASAARPPLAQPQPPKKRLGRKKAANFFLPSPAKGISSTAAPAVAAPAPAARTPDKKKPPPARPLITAPLQLQQQAHATVRPNHSKVGFSMLSALSAASASPSFGGMSSSRVAASSTASIAPSSLPVSSLSRLAPASFSCHSTTPVTAASTAAAAFPSESASSRFGQFVSKQRNHQASVPGARSIDELDQRQQVQQQEKEEGNKEQRTSPRKRKQISSASVSPAKAPAVAEPTEPTIKRPRVLRPTFPPVSLAHLFDAAATPALQAPSSSSSATSSSRPSSPSRTLIPAIPLHRSTLAALHLKEEIRTFASSLIDELQLAYQHIQELKRED